MHACICVCMYVCVYVCMYMYMYVRMHACIYECICVHVYVCMYICMYVFTNTFRTDFFSRFTTLWGNTEILFDLLPYSSALLLLALLPLALLPLLCFPSPVALAISSTPLSLPSPQPLPLQLDAAPLSLPLPPITLSINSSPARAHSPICRSFSCARARARSLFITAVPITKLFAWVRAVNIQMRQIAVDYTIA
jgi:hypothetical protein